MNDEWKLELEYIAWWMHALVVLYRRLDPTATWIKTFFYILCHASPNNYLVFVNFLVWNNMYVQCTLYILFLDNRPCPLTLGYHGSVGANHIFCSRFSFISLVQYSLNCEKQKDGHFASEKQTLKSFLHTNNLVKLVD